MATGLRATFVFSWSQTEVDGLAAAPIGALAVGGVWRWTGRAVRVDGARDILLLDGAEGQTDLRRRAARMVRRLVGTALAVSAPADGLAMSASMEGQDFPAPDQSFVVTDGTSSHVLTLIPVPNQTAPLLMVEGGLPPPDTDLWVVRSDVALPLEQGPVTEGGMICFAPGTLIATPAGPVPVERLAPGDLVLTRDDGPQPVFWTGGRRITGARLHVMPHLRPVRLRRGLYGTGAAERDLIVSPSHRILLRGPAARALFNVPEVLVAAGDLTDGAGVDRTLREITYVHLLLERHQILVANGVETESFRPDPGAVAMLSDADRTRLLEVCPALATDPAGVLPPARRLLTRSEAAILCHDRAA